MSIDEERVGCFPTDNSFMTLRDWFAGQALTAILTGQLQHIELNAKLYAQIAYIAADAMLEVRRA